MELKIKQVQQNGETFAPLTVSEAVLVKDNSQILTLDKVLDKKIETISTPTGSGLSSFPLGKSVIITHSNIITSNTEPESLNILYDSHGHIVNTTPTLPLVLTVDNTLYVNYTGNSELRVNLGDDFKIDETNKVALKWKEL